MPLYYNISNFFNGTAFYDHDRDLLIFTEKVENTDHETQIFLLTSFFKQFVDNFWYYFNVEELLDVLFPSDG